MDILILKIGLNGRLSALGWLNLENFLKNVSYDKKYGLKKFKTTSLKTVMFLSQQIVNVL